MLGTITASTETVSYVF